MSHRAPGYRFQYHVPPTSSAASSTTALKPARRMRTSWYIPANPAPTITTSTSVLFSVMLMSPSVVPAQLFHSGWCGADAELRQTRGMTNASTTVVALLRGVNVGGHNKLPMAQLREIAAAAGFTEVRTYIQSGKTAWPRPSSTSNAAGTVLAEAILTADRAPVPVIVRQPGSGPTPSLPTRSRLPRTRVAMSTSSSCRPRRPRR